ncbi:hypothetical protein IscW_ISCW022891 [Ixodes scapularis]|uniref:Uncharacterized protein n=1 Tax=Ixodes scapularis TaxID=6945 RepID=B7QD62_IXOSC|nr:hypothetical protein IscW_ISCW022891 [Ixodes scapularis]|eukprot:XP_002413476.1 hypothetical protein IscW_ISCW022891 [Ixodes scapularis]
MVKKGADEGADTVRKVEPLKNAQNSFVVHVVVVCTVYIRGDEPAYTVGAAVHERHSRQMFQAVLGTQARPKFNLGWVVLSKVLEPQNDAWPPYIQGACIESGYVPEHEDCIQGVQKPPLGQLFHIQLRKGHYPIRRQSVLKPGSVGPTSANKEAGGGNEGPPAARPPGSIAGTTTTAVLKCGDLELLYARATGDVEFNHGV